MSHNYHTRLYQPVDQRWVGDVYRVNLSTLERERIHCGAAHRELGDAMREAETAIEADRTMTSAAAT